MTFLIRERFIGALTRHEDQLENNFKITAVICLSLLKSGSLYARVAFGRKNCV